MAKSPNYSQSQVDFASEVSKQTGADFYTIFGWELAEGGPSDNPLNIGPGQHFGDPIHAADVTSKMIETSNLYTDILQSFQGKYSSEDAAIAAQSKAIAYNQHWNVIKGTPTQIAAGRKQYLTNIDSGALEAIYEGIQPNSKITQLPGGGQGIQNPADNPLGGGIFGGVTGAIGGLAHDIAAPFEFIQSHWERILFVIGGAILVIIALIFIGLSVKSNVMSFKSGGE